MHPCVFRKSDYTLERYNNYETHYRFDGRVKIAATMLEKEMVCSVARIIIRE